MPIAVRPHDAGHTVQAPRHQSNIDVAKLKVRRHNNRRRRSTLDGRRKISRSKYALNIGRSFASSLLARRIGADHILADRQALEFIYPVLIAGCGETKALSSGFHRMDVGAGDRSSILIKDATRDGAKV